MSDDKPQKKTVKKPTYADGRKKHLTLETGRAPGSGRPLEYHLTPEILESIGKDIELGLSYQAACLRAGIPRHIFYLWLGRAEEDPTSDYGELLRICEVHEANREAKALGIIWDAAKGKHGGRAQWQAAGWLNERLIQHRYSLIYKEKQDEEIKLTVKDAVTEALLRAKETLELQRQTDGTYALPKPEEPDSSNA